MITSCFSQKNWCHGIWKSLATSTVQIFDCLHLLFWPPHSLCDNSTPARLTWSFVSESLQPLEGLPTFQLDCLLLVAPGAKDLVTILLVVLSVTSNLLITKGSKDLTSDFEMTVFEVPRWLSAWKNRCIFFTSYQVTTRIFNECPKKNHAKTLHKIVNMPIICI